VNEEAMARDWAAEPRKQQIEYKGIELKLQKVILNYELNINAKK
jgi:hypothetical protein